MEARNRVRRDFLQFGLEPGRSCILGKLSAGFCKYVSSLNSLLWSPTSRLAGGIGLGLGLQSPPNFAQFSGFLIQLLNGIQTKDVSTR